MTADQPTIPFPCERQAEENLVGQHNPRFASAHFDADVSGRASFHLGFELGTFNQCLAELQTVQISEYNIFEQQQENFNLLHWLMADSFFFFFLKSNKYLHNMYLKSDEERGKGEKKYDMPLVSLKGVSFKSSFEIIFRG